MIMSDSKTLLPNIVQYHPIELAYPMKTIPTEGHHGIEQPPYKDIKFHILEYNLLY
jgi:hypothetical protein